MMKNEKTYAERLKYAQKRVKSIRDFHTHVVVYILVNAFLIIIGGHVLNLTTRDGSNPDPNLQEWLNWNNYLTPALWGIGLLLNGIYVYRHKFHFFKRWEERQIQKYLKEERQEDDRFNRK